MEGDMGIGGRHILANPSMLASTASIHTMMERNDVFSDIWALSVDERRKRVMLARELDRARETLVKQQRQNVRLARTKHHRKEFDDAEKSREKAVDVLGKSQTKHWKSVEEMEATLTNRYIVSCCPRLCFFLEMANRDLLTCRRTPFQSKSLISRRWVC
jgi:hypothetical protein